QLSSKIRQILPNIQKCSKNSFIEIIKSGVPDHKPIFISRFISVTNDICSYNNYMDTHVSYYQQSCKRDRVRYRHIEGVLNEKKLLGIQDLENKEVETSLKVSKKNDKLKLNTEKKVEEMSIENPFVKDNTVKYLNPYLDRRNMEYHEISESENAIKGGKKNMTTTPQRSPKLSKEEWRNEWFKNLKMITVYFENQLPNNQSSSKEVDKLFLCMSETFRDKLGSIVVDSYSDKVDILILKSELSNFKSLDSPVSYTLAKSRNLSGKGVRIWPFKKTVRFLENLNVGFDKNNLTLGISLDKGGTEVTKQPMYSPSNDIDTNAESNVVFGVVLDGGDNKITDSVNYPNGGTTNLLHETGDEGRNGDTGGNSSPKDVIKMDGPEEDKPNEDKPNEEKPNEDKPNEDNNMEMEIKMKNKELTPNYSSDGSMDQIGLYRELISAEQSLDEIEIIDDEEINSDEETNSDEEINGDEKGLLLNNSPVEIESQHWGTLVDLSASEEVYQTKTVPSKKDKAENQFEVNETIVEVETNQIHKNTDENFELPKENLLESLKLQNKQFIIEDKKKCEEVEYLKNLLEISLHALQVRDTALNNAKNLIQKLSGELSDQEIKIASLSSKLKATQKSARSNKNNGPLL
ncbi:hypothetical protein Kpol_269p1, partial [Vanderwaltozyma polyspora DSM 70294]